MTYIKNILSATLLSLITVGIVTTATATPARAASGVNNFSITNYRIDYDLSRDSEGRSSLKTVETIDALFPDFDQNHGLERAIPNSYDGRSTSLRINSVTDGNGKAREYTTRDSNDNTVLRIGDADSYVRGLQRYVITYTQRDVTRYFDNTKSDEFYWDTNGTEWAVPITALTVNLRISNDLNRQQTGKAQCYFGYSGATDQCILNETTGGYNLQASNLAPGKNATIAVGFKPQTFKGYVMSASERLAILWTKALIATSILATGLLVWFIARYYRKSNRTAEHTTVVPEYVPPKDTSVTTAATVYRNARAVFSAQLIDLAVRHYVVIRQTRQKSFFRKAQYEIEIIKDISGLKAEEQEILNDIFDSTTVGSILELAKMKRNSAKIATKLSDNASKLSKSIKGAYGIRHRDASQSDWFKRAGYYTLAAAIVTLSPGLLIVAIVAFAFSSTLYPLTDKGLALYHYLEGLKLYIGVAEAERIKMLQGPDTAEKIGEQVIDVNDSGQMIKLYEKVLPYAMIFGQEKAWNDRLGHYYESLDQSPNWLVGSNSNAAFNAAIFSSAISDFNTAATYSNPASSSSGGSGGGGSSGGGGGGGGGGGW